MIFGLAASPGLSGPVIYHNRKSRQFEPAAAGRSDAGIVREIDGPGRNFV
jgi:hypothetical protein